MTWQAAPAHLMRILRALGANLATNSPPSQTQLMSSGTPLLYDVPTEAEQIFWQAAGRGDSLCCVSDVTRMIEAIQQGDPKAADELLPLVYEELRRLAASKMANEAAGNTLQPTALVHEAWLRLVGNDNPKFAGRAHF